MKIVADSDIPFLRGVLEPYAEVVYRRGYEISPTDVADAEALVVRTRTRCDEALLGGSAVRLICTATVGFDHIDMDYCARRGIRVATSAGCNAWAVLRWIAAALAYIYKGKAPGLAPGPGSAAASFTPAGTTLGVVGVGNVGRLVARYAAQWGFRVVCCDPPRQRDEAGAVGTPTAERGVEDEVGDFVSFEQLVPQCDIVTFHVPLNRGGCDNTFHMAGPEFFDALRPGAVALNASRGEVIDSVALRRALDEGRCACVIDTWENEPRADARLVRAALLATPHIAGYSQQGKAMSVAMAVRALGEEFGWPLAGWYPPDGTPPVEHRPIGWEEMRRTIGAHFDIEALSRRFKSDPAAFEQMRDTYVYRSEYF